jgi:hypothetical protein
VPLRCLYRTRTAFDLTNNSVMINVVDVSDYVPGVEIFLEIEDDYENRVEIGVHTTQSMVNEVYYRTTIGGSASLNATKLTDFSEMKRFLHLGLKDGFVVWGTSSDGNSPGPSNLPTQDKDPFPIFGSAVHVSFGMVTNESANLSTPITATFDNYNVIQTMMP